MEAATSSYSTTGKFFAICLFYACRQEPSEDPIKVFSSWIFLHRYFLTIRALLKKNSLWLLSIYMDVASYCYYEKGSRTNARSLSIFILFQLQSWIILRVRTMFLLRNNIESENDVFAQELSCEETDFWDSDDEYI